MEFNQSSDKYSKDQFDQRNKKDQIKFDDISALEEIARGQSTVGSAVEAVSAQELSPEQAWLSAFKTRFGSFQCLHEGIKWADVEKSLKANPESMAKLQALDEKGHAMNVFGEENGEYIFVSAWANHTQVAEAHKNITYDLESQKWVKSNGNAVDIAKLMGVDLADRKFHKQLSKNIGVNGWAWLKTDDSIRGCDRAHIGYCHGVNCEDVRFLSSASSFRAELRVKKF